MSSALQSRGNEFLRRSFDVLGIDAAVAITLCWRLWMAGAGAVSLFFVALTLSSEEQGYYFTFDSLLNLKIIFELGLSYVLMQFASHEMCSLSWNAEGLLAGSADSLHRLRDLFRLALRWYAVTATLLALVLVPLGFLFFASGKASSAVHWSGAWILLVCATAASVLISPFWAILEGCGLVASVARVRLTESLCNALLLWLLLWFRFGLWSIAVATLMGVLTQTVWLGLKYRTSLADLSTRRNGPSVLNWRTEIWPFQWRMALSWFSGYCIFTIFNPLVFRILGPVAAGRIGMTFAVAQGIVTLSIVVVKTKAPAFGTLLAKRDFGALDRLFKHSVRRSMLIVVVMAVGFWSAVVLLSAQGSHYAARFLEPVQVGIIMAATLVNCMTQSVAIYLRANKEEPLLLPSVFSAVISLPLNYVLILRFGTIGGCIGFLIVSLFVNGLWSLAIFFRKRRLFTQSNLFSPMDAPVLATNLRN